MPHHKISIAHGHTRSRLYQGHLGSRLSFRLGLKAALGGCVLLLLSACGSLRLPDDDTMVTGALKVQPVALRLPKGDPPDGILASDWTQATAALGQALSAREPGASIPWDNPATGARGTSTPFGEVRDTGCRDFRIGIVGTSGEHWVQGEVCKDTTGAFSLSQVRVLGRA